MKKAAYFGLGNMGLPIALNLIKAGVRVTTAIHKSDKGPNALKQAGGFIAASNAEAVKDAEVIFTIVSDDAALESLMLDERMIEAVRPGSVIVEMTSCSARAVQKIAEAYRAKNVSVVDAPVTGGTTGAAAGTMTMFVGSEDEPFDRVLPLLKTISKVQCRVGAVGDGKKVKALNNLMGAAHVLMASEAVRLIKKNNIDPDKFFEAISNGSGNSRQFQIGFNKLITENFTPTFSLGLMRKDVNLAMELAEGLHLPISELAQKQYEAAMKYADEDFYAVYKLL